MSDSSNSPYKILYSIIRIASNQLDIHTPAICFVEQNELSNPSITAMYLQNSRSIVFNKDWVQKCNLIELIATCFHECRHAYQHNCVVNKSRESIEIIQVWEMELNNYSQPSVFVDPKQDTDYLLQKIEIDAIIYAYRKMKDYFNIRIKIPKAIFNTEL